MRRNGASKMLVWISRHVSVPTPLLIPMVVLPLALLTESWQVAGAGFSACLIGLGLAFRGRRRHPHETTDGENVLPRSRTGALLRLVEARLERQRHGDRQHGAESAEPTPQLDELTRDLLRVVARLRDFDSRGDLRRACQAAPDRKRLATRLAAVIRALGLVRSAIDDIPVGAAAAPRPGRPRLRVLPGGARSGEPRNRVGTLPRGQRDQLHQNGIAGAAHHRGPCWRAPG